MEDNKPWWASRTILSSAAIALLAAASLVGFMPGEGDAATLTDSLDQIITGVLALVAIYGRVTASRKIGRPV